MFVLRIILSGAGYLEEPSPDSDTFRVLPLGPGMHEPQAGFCARCGRGAVCREGKAAADRTCNRTVISPDRAPDRSEPEQGESREIHKRIYLDHISLRGRESGLLIGHVTGNNTVSQSSISAYEGNCHQRFLKVLNANAISFLFKN